MASTHSSGLELDVPDAGNPLPKEILWVAVLGSPAATVLIERDLFSHTWREVLILMVANLVPFILFPLSFFSLYQWVFPPVLRRLDSGVKRWAFHLLVVTVVSVGLSGVIEPIHCAISGVPISQRGEFAVISVIFSFLIIIPAIGLKRLSTRARNVERIAFAQRQATLEAQLQALQARTNPHFFFNSINTVASLIPEDPRLAERTLERLADLFRYALESGKVKTVTLRREVEVIRDYLAIAQARFGEKLVVSVELDEAAAGVMVPPLMLQPLVENALVHGTAARGSGEVRVSVRRDGDRVWIEVTDDGPGPGLSNHAGTQTSVAELKQRLLLMYGEGQGGTFELLAGPRGGCVARLGIPFA